MESWTAHRTQNDQGVDFRELKLNGRVSKLEFIIKPKSKYWRAGFKLVDPNETILPLRNNNSLLFHLGSSLSNNEYGYTAYLNGNHIKELNKTKKYPNNKLLFVRLEIDHNNFLSVYVNNSLEFKPSWRLKPSIREKVVLIAWGDSKDFSVDIKNIIILNWKERSDKEKKIITKKTIYSYISSLTNPQKFSGAIIVGVIILIIGYLILPRSDMTSSFIPSPTPEEILSVTPTFIPTVAISSNESISIDESSSYIDNVSGITIGVNWILDRSYVTLTLTFPSKNSEEYNEVKSGRIFKFLGKNGVSYALTITEIGYNSINIKINSEL